MEVWYSIAGTAKIEINVEDSRQMLKDKVNIEDINSIDNWIRKNIGVDMNIDIFNTDIEETRIEGCLLSEDEEYLLSEDEEYLLSEDEESALLEVQKELEENLPMKNQLDLFGSLV